MAAAIKKLGDVDLVIAGRNSTDDESGAFGPALARSLGWPQLTYVGKLAELEDELTSWVPGQGPSPNRLDALVHGATDLLKRLEPVAVAEGPPEVLRQETRIQEAYLGLR